MPAVRTLAAEAGCSAGTVVHAYGRLESLGLVARRDRSRARVVVGARVRARMLLRAPRPVRLSGSDDPALDLVLRAVGEEVAADSGPRGSVTGLNRLARGEADLAFVHLLDVASGTYNDPFVRRLLADEPVVLVHLWRREQGLVRAARQPACQSRRSRDLAGLRLAWRSAGAADRVCCSSGCCAEAGVEATRRAGAWSIHIVRSPRRWRRAPPTPGWRCGQSRGARSGLRGRLAVEPFELAVRASATST